MKRAFALAKKGVGFTSPNPCVGAVIVKNGEIVSENWHRHAGGAHAEILAMKDLDDLSDCELYVTLEPCSHHGKTGPCCEAILKSGIRNVFVGMQDPNPMVNGRGIDFLRSNGIEVSVFDDSELLKINQPFIKSVKHGLPYVTLKAGMSLDGKIALKDGRSKWITNELARMDGRLERSKCDAVIIGYNTVMHDNPTLLTYGEFKDKNLLKIIVGRVDDFDRSARIFRDNKIICIEFSDLNECFLRKLNEDGIQSLYVEGGSALHGAFYDMFNSNPLLVDKVIFYYAPTIIGGKGLPAFSGKGVVDLQSVQNLQDVSLDLLGDNLKLEGFFNLYS